MRGQAKSSKRGIDVCVVEEIAVNLDGYEMSIYGVLLYHSAARRASSPTAVVSYRGASPSPPS